VVGDNTNNGKNVNRASDARSRISEKGKGADYTSTALGMPNQSPEWSRLGPSFLSTKIVT
jgi:hypothetical protein